MPIRYRGGLGDDPYLVVEEPDPRFIYGPTVAPARASVWLGRGVVFGPPALLALVLLWFAPNAALAVAVIFYPVALVAWIVVLDRGGDLIAWLGRGRAKRGNDSSPPPAIPAPAPRADSAG